MKIYILIAIVAIGLLLSFKLYLKFSQTVNLGILTSFVGYSSIHIATFDSENITHHGLYSLPGACSSIATITLDGENNPNPLLSFERSIEISGSAWVRKGYAVHQSNNYHKKKHTFGQVG